MIVSKNIKLIIKIILLVIILFILFFVSKLILKNFYSISKKALEISQINLKIENSYSSLIEENLKKFFELKTKNINLNNFNSESFYKDLKSNFKLVKKVEFNFSKPTELQVQVFLIKSKYLVNNNFIIGDKKRVFSKDNFEKIDFNFLKKVYINPALVKTKLDIEVYNFLENITGYIWQNYEINYLSSNNIILKPKDILDLNFYLITEQNLTFFKTEKNMSYLSKIFYYCLNNKNKSTKAYLVDLRFENRVYLRPIKTQDWGGDYGKENI